MKKSKFISIIFSTIVCVMMMIGCTTDQNSGQSAQSSGNDDGNKITSLQSVIDDPNVKDGSEIDLSQYKDIKDFNYNAIINKSVTIKNGDDLKGAKLEVVTDGVTLDSIKSASVTTQSSLKISSSSLSSLNIGEVSRGRGEETINPPTVETDNTTVANKVTVGIENAQIVAETLMAGEINLTGMNTQLTLKDNESSISKITTDTVCQVVLEKGVGTN
ncbi:MAG: hypothetical protein J6W76_02450, partial [Spirochaetales bacterium]|nr:hypothetical protein [Spirochaetales bacterium]